MERDALQMSCGVDVVTGLRSRRRGAGLVQEFERILMEPEWGDMEAMPFGAVIFSDRWTAGKSPGARLAKALEEAYPNSIEMSRPIKNPNHNSSIRIWTFHIPKSLRERAKKEFKKRENYW